MSKQPVKVSREPDRTPGQAPLPGFPSTNAEPRSAFRSRRQRSKGTPRSTCDRRRPFVPSLSRGLLSTKKPVTFSHAAWPVCAAMEIGVVPVSSRESFLVASRARRGFPNAALDYHRGCQRQCTSEWTSARPAWETTVGHRPFQCKNGVIYPPGAGARAIEAACTTCLHASCRRPPMLVFPLRCRANPGGPMRADLVIPFAPAKKSHI